MYYNTVFSPCICNNILLMPSWLIKYIYFLCKLPLEELAEEDHLRGVCSNLPAPPPFLTENNRKILNELRL